MNIGVFVQQIFRPLLCKVGLGMLTTLTNVRSTKVLWYAEDDLWWKVNFCQRRPLVEDNLLWKATFGGRHPLAEDDLWWKITFSRRLPLVEEDLWWKTTFGGG